MTVAPVIALRPQSSIGSRGELEVSTALMRGFLGISDGELVELTAFVNGKAWVCQCVGADAHVDALRRADSIRGYCGSYMLVNGPVDPDLGYRYPRNQWQPANNGRATDKDIGTRRAIFVDVDPIRPKGISSTDDQLNAACDVAHSMREWLSTIVGREAIGLGCSGNGFYLLVALEPEAEPNASTLGVARFLKALGSKYGTNGVKIDGAVANPARLMSAPGTWKRKGIDTPERPHRLTTFSCCGSITRVRLGDLI
ncbi:MAG: hypothetical protein ACM3ZE_24010 [Myxococcales bacterium]